MHVVPCVALLSAAVALLGCNTAPAPTSGNNSPAAESAPRVARADPTSDSSPYESRRHRSPHNRSAPSASSNPGDFDFYLLNLSWSPEFCATHPASSECAAHPGFVVHGLWPQNTDGTYPENCSDTPGPANPSAYMDVIPTASLVEHEWATHGTCSGLTPDAYFGLIRLAFHAVRIPATLVNSRQPTTQPPADILSSFAQINTGFPPDSFALSCGNNYLTAVEVCLDKNLHPESCQSVRTCHANTVRITPR
jgi:ribonuclease T2